MISKYAKICVVEVTELGGHSEWYKTRLEMVLAALNRGDIGDGVVGSNTHQEALNKIMARAQELLINYISQEDDAISCLCEEHGEE